MDKSASSVEIDGEDAEIIPGPKTGWTEDSVQPIYHRDKLRSIAHDIPEVHFLGEICEGSEFNGQALTCQWTVEWSEKSWSLLEGSKDGKSQYAIIADDNSCIWNHPIDLHFTAASVKGWPRILLQVWNLDSYGRSNLVGYGFAHLPSSPGASKHCIV